MYPSYLSKVNQRMAIPSSFTLSFYGSGSGLDYTFLILAEKVGDYSGTNLVLHVVWVESHIPYNWGGLSEVNFVNRLMVPTANGTALNFSGGNIQAVPISFSKSASWVTANSHIAVFIQNNSTKEILQGYFLNPMYFNNASLQELSMVPVTNCSGEIQPQVVIANDGSSNLTSLEISYKVNDESIHTYAWSGNLGYGASETVLLPPITFDLLNENDLVVYTSNPNGSADENPITDTLYHPFVTGQQVIPGVQLYLQLDQKPFETTYELKNSTGETLYSGGPFTEPQAVIEHFFELDIEDCFTFIIYDLGGDGLTAPGYFSLRQSDQEVFYENAGFTGSLEQVEFSVKLTGLAGQQTKEFNVYPNPVRDYAIVDFYLEKPGEVELTVYDITGKPVFSSVAKLYGSGANQIFVDSYKLKPGVYFVKLGMADKVLTRKITRY